MSVNRDLNTALSRIAGADRVFDTEADPGTQPDPLPYFVFQSISEVPFVPIDGEIIGYDDQWQVSVYAKNLPDARAAKGAVVQALHAFSGETIKRAEYESAVELPDLMNNPPRFHIALTFTIYR